MKRFLFIPAILGMAVVALSAQSKPPAAAANPAANPVLVFDTAKGSFEIELFKNETPKSVDHILALMKRSFYRGQHFHRVTANLVQFGDPQSRDMSRRDYWGTGGSGSPIGVFELSKSRHNVRGAVGLGHSGNPAGADSQLFILKTDQSANDGKYAIIGRVSTGMAVIDKIAVEDMIKNASLK